MNFILEGSLKGLNKWLRFLGYRTEICEKKITKETLLQNKDKVFLITSLETAEIAKKIGVKFLLLPKENLKTQLFMVITKFNLTPKLKLDLCSLCGEKLIPVQKENFKDEIPPRVYQSINKYNYCLKCKKLYWEGDHIKRLKEKFRKLLSLNVQSKD